MGSDAYQRPAFFTLPNFLILALIATGIIATRQPLRSQRPSAEAPATSAVSAGEYGKNPHNVADVPLWQDPFLAAREFERRVIDPGWGAANSGFDALWVPEAARVQRVVFAMIPVTQTQESIEQRLRSRQAVLAAMRSEGYAPLNTRRIFHLLVPRTDLKLQWGVPEEYWLPAPRGYKFDAPPAPEVQMKGAQRLNAVDERLHLVSLQEGPQPDESAAESAAEAAEALTEPGSGMLVIPYEWFGSDEVQERAGYSRERNHTLVLWLAEGSFGAENLAALERLMYQLNEQCTNPDVRRSYIPEPPPPDANASSRTPRVRHVSIDAQLASQRDRRVDAPSFALVGPTSSTTLKSMYSEAVLRQREGQVLNWIKTLSIYVTTPTVETFFTIDRKLAAASSSLGSLEEDFAQQFGVRRFIRVSETDDLMAEALIDELQKRGLRVTPSSPNWQIAFANRDSETLDNIALICEHETYFGRAFAQTFSAALWHKAEHDGQSYRERDGLWRRSHASVPPNVHVYYYPRGVDATAYSHGVERRQSELAADSTSRPDSLATSPRVPERPEGPGQLDYIRRLAHSLSAEYRRGGRSRLRAIGIVGTDVYDKMLLLRALRDEFPDMLFFTTELDARLLHHTNFRFTRNLIVASTYGLRLRERYQRTSGIATFRDSGQTAAYVACRLAISADRESNRTSADVNPDEQGVILPDQVRATIHQPMVFEIGNEVAATLAPTIQEAHVLHPPLHRNLGAWYWILTTTAVSLFTAMLVYVLPPVRDRLSAVGYSVLRLLRLRPVRDPLHNTEVATEYDAPLAKKRIRLLAWVSAITLVITLPLLIAVPASHYWGGEVFSIRAGYSSWPSILINHLAFVLTLFFLVEVWYTLRRAEYTLDHAFKLSGGRLPARLGTFLPLSVWKPRLDDGCVVVNQLWEQCKSLGGLSNRAVRVGGMFLILAGFWLTLYFLYGQSSEPFRGATNLFYGRAVSISALAGLALLTLLVVDATTLVLVFVRNLADNESRYKDATLECFWQSQFTEGGVLGPVDSRVPSEKLQRIVHYADIAVIGELTSSVFRVILYPFIVLTLMILARSKTFDNFVWSTVLVAVYGMLFAYAVWCAVVLQRTAERTRRRAVETLNRKLDAVKQGDQRKAKDAVQVYEAAIRRIEGTHEGAFMSLFENPILRAVLLPTGGTTLVALFEYFLL